MANPQTVERTNAKQPTVSGPIAVLDGATGWSKDYLDQWIKLDNAIPYRSKAARDASQFTDHKIGVDNFTSVELRTANIEGKDYPMLVMWRKQGAYKYPVIEEDYFEFESGQFLVFREWTPTLTDEHPDNKAYRKVFKPYVFGMIEVRPLEDPTKVLRDQLQFFISAGAIADESGWSKLDLNKVVGTKVSEEPMIAKVKYSFELLVFPVVLDGVRSVRFLFREGMDFEGLGDDFYSRSGMTGLELDEKIGKELSEFDKWYFEVPREKFLKFWNATFGPK